MFQQQGI